MVSIHNHKRRHIYQMKLFPKLLFVPPENLSWSLWSQLQSQRLSSKQELYLRHFIKHYQKVLCRTIVFCSKFRISSLNMKIFSSKTHRKIHSWFLVRTKLSTDVFQLYQTQFHLISSKQPFHLHLVASTWTHHMAPVSPQHIASHSTLRSHIIWLFLRFWALERSYRLVWPFWLDFCQIRSFQK